MDQNPPSSEGQRITLEDALRNSLQEGRFLLSQVDSLALDASAIPALRALLDDPEWGPADLAALLVGAERPGDRYDSVLHCTAERLEALAPVSVWLMGTATFDGERVQLSNGARPDVVLPRDGRLVVCLESAIGTLSMLCVRAGDLTAFRRERERIRGFVTRRVERTPA